MKNITLQKAITENRKTEDKIKNRKQETEYKKP